jgi:acyl dehydratase
VVAGIRSRTRRDIVVLYARRGDPAPPLLYSTGRGRVFPEAAMPGRYFDDLEPGQTIRHPLSRTVTEADNVLFCSLTANTQPLHLDEEFASTTPFGRRIVNGIYTLGLVVGLTVADLTEGTIVANLSYEKVVHPKPVFHGDTISVVTEVLEKRPSRSNPDRGIVRLRHKGTNQRGETVVELERTVLFLRKPA